MIGSLHGNGIPSFGSLKENDRMHIMNGIFIHNFWWLSLSTFLGHREIEVNLKDKEFKVVLDSQ